MQDDLTARLRYWFFRELSGDQRMSLIRLTLGEKIAAEAGEVQGHQARCLTTILASLAGQPETQEAEIEKLTLDRLQFKKWWNQERARNEKLENEITRLRAQVDAIRDETLDSEFVPKEEREVTMPLPKSEWEAECMIAAIRGCYPNAGKDAHIAELVEALKLARNRLQRCAVDAIVNAWPAHYEWSVWADEADQALAKHKDTHDDS